ncbi:apolipoprotein D-like [Microplitis mediator]|uniref:apolipoprotein D-like n=1 Tax=Microplitis mediator TaxID=375433 RepID=UPI002555FED8|nr:apolipoprotein D-like [Microplitis mediator]
MLGVKIIFCLIAIPLSQATQCHKTCPNITVDPVDFEKMSGPWYEYQRSTNNCGPDKCPKLVWGKPVKCVSKLVYKSVSNLTNVTSTMISQVVSNKQGTGFTYHLPIYGNLYKEHLIIATDYVSYAIVYTCEKRGSKIVELGWVFIRRMSPPCDIEDIVEEAFNNYDLEVPEMFTNDLESCACVFCNYQFPAI